MRAVARKAFVAGTWLVLASILVQVLLAGLGVFASAEFFFWHASVNAVVVGCLPLVLVLVGWFARAPRDILWLTATVPGLTALQSLLLLPYHMNAQGVLRAISGLHVLNAIFIFWVALKLLERTLDWSAGAAPNRLADPPDERTGAAIAPGGSGGGPRGSPGRGRPGR